MQEVKRNMERDLAIAVILRTIRDLVEDRDCAEECITFLLGQTETSRFWFEVAGINALRPKDFDRKALVRAATSLKSSMKRAKNGNVLDNY